MIENTRALYDSKSTVKLFSYKGKNFTEKVARYPKILYQGGAAPAESPVLAGGFYPAGKKSIFSLRIDVDEADNEKELSGYIDIFAPYSQWITLFCSAKAFAGKEHILKRAQSAGLDIQSHGYYHYTHNDYRNNYNNLYKAKRFFSDMGIETEGFASPMGKYNDDLMRALEDLGYRYSSDFSFDYLNFPHYPRMGNRFSKVLQIPIFPVCPELLFLAGLTEDEAFDYYTGAMELIKKSGIPVIVYAHTNKFCDKVMRLLGRLLKTAQSDGELHKCNLTAFARWCSGIEDKKYSERRGMLNASVAGAVRPPDGELLGTPSRRGIWAAVKDSIKEIADLEDMVPLNELADGGTKLFVKKAFRSLKRKSRT